MEPIKPPPDGNDKHPTLRRWCVKEVVAQNGTCTRHVYGHDVTNDAGRASSAIRAFNMETMTATTYSGTHYKLAGVPGHSQAGDYVWDSWCRINAVVSQKDVTDEYFNADALFNRQHDKPAEAAETDGK